MKTFKLKLISFYTCAQCIKDAITVYRSKGIEVTEKDIEMVDVEPNPESFGMVFRSLKGYQSFSAVLN
jgi:hypothetical protein